MLNGVRPQKLIRFSIQLLDAFISVAKVTAPSTYMYDAKSLNQKYSLIFTTEYTTQDILYSSHDSCVTRVLRDSILALHDSCVTRFLRYTILALHYYILRNYLNPLVQFRSVL